MSHASYHERHSIARFGLAATILSAVFLLAACQANSLLTAVQQRVQVANTGTTNGAKTAQEYTVTYDSNGADGGTVPVDDNQYKKGESVTVLGNIRDLTRTGFKFNGWNTATDGTGATYLAGTTFTIGTADVTLYAQWTAIHYIVTYDGNNNTGGTVPTDSSTYTLGQTVTVLSNTGVLTETDGTFNGWNTKVDGSGTSYSASGTFTMGNSDLTLYAQWKGTYNIGDNGPAGGIIFYDKGTFTDGWRFLEAAPNDLTTTSWYNSSFIATGADQTAAGDGDLNTQMIVAAQGSGTYAASEAESYSLHGYSDWYLPDLDEGNGLIDQASFLGLSGTAYWTSTESTYSANYSTYAADLVSANPMPPYPCPNPQSQPGGFCSPDRKDSVWSVRPIRKF